MPKITELCAWVIANKDEHDEGVPAIAIGEWVVPLMGADMERAESLRKYAQRVANENNKPVKLIRCQQLEIVAVVHPDIDKTSN